MSELDALARRKKRLAVGDATIAYLEQGEGPPVLLLHGCPFSSFVWRNVIPELATDRRCLAPDLLGLGDTDTPPDADWSIGAQAGMVVGFLDALGLERAHVVGHDQGGAIAQLLAAHHPDRVDRLVLSNAEAYDNWPARRELPYVRATQLPLFGPARGVARLETQHLPLGARLGRRGQRPIRARRRAAGRLHPRQRR